MASTQQQLLAQPGRASFHIVAALGCGIVFLSAGGFAYLYTKRPVGDSDQEEPFASSAFHVFVVTVYGSYLYAIIVVSFINWCISIRIVGKVREREHTRRYLVKYNMGTNSCDSINHTLIWNTNVTVRDWEHGDSIQCAQGEKVMDLLVVKGYPASARPCRRLFGGLLRCPYYSKYSFAPCGCHPLVWIVCFIFFALCVSGPKPFIWYLWPALNIPMAVLHAIAALGSLLWVWPSQLYNYGTALTDGYNNSNNNTAPYTTPVDGDDYVAMTHNNVSPEAV